MTDPALLRRLSANVQAAAAEGREVFDIGPYRAFLDPATDLIYLNYAVPARPAADWGGALDELAAAFAARGRRLRFEFFADEWPDLAPALEAAGLVREAANPLMLLTAPNLRIPPPGAGRVHLLAADDPDAVYLDYYRTGAIGFGMAETGQDDRAAAARDRPRVAAGRLLPAISYLEDGTPAAVGCLMASAGVAEMAGVATIPGARRRGLAARLCHALLADGFARGVELVWLGAGDEGAAALYASLGFKAAGAQLAYAAPGGPG
ncbi:MAG TPA: GNAT family N-acetyltransferase [Alphaproteobacteria bacterium]|nr:GNAT family N-acetyltransferase [Alphaproteobacteria bacterium]